MRTHDRSLNLSLLSGAMALALAAAAGSAAAHEPHPHPQQQHSTSQQATDQEEKDRHGSMGTERKQGSGETGQTQMGMSRNQQEPDLRGEQPRARDERYDATSGTAAGNSMERGSTSPAGTGMAAGAAGAAAEVDDAVLRARVKSALQQSTNGVADDIRVQVDDGMVMLVGTVDGESQVAQAVQAVRGVQGVREVRATELRARSVELRAAGQESKVENPAMLAKRAHADDKSEQPLSDTWITTKVKTKLLADSDVAGREIDVRTVNGVVMLSGYVEDREDLGLVVGTARATDGVRDVRSAELRVGTAGSAGDAGREMEEERTAGAMQSNADRSPRRNDAAASSSSRDSDQPLSDAWITTKVKTSLLANPDISGLNVDVETVNGVVRLSGSVSSQEQVDRVMAATRSIEGVRDVDATDLQQVAAAD